jgi:acyl carrier protein
VHIEHDVTTVVIATVVRVFNVQSGVISPETTAADVEGWDSVSNSRLYFELEERFDRQLPIERLLDAANVGELCDIISACLLA